MTECTETFLVDVIRDMLSAEADYRSAMSIYKDHPGHMTRIRAESRWHHAKQIAKAAVGGAWPVVGEITKSNE